MTKRSRKKKQKSKPKAVVVPRTMQKALSLTAIVQYGKDIGQIDQSKYKSKYIKMLEAHMEAGGQLFQFVRKIGVHRSTMERWMADPKHRALKDAAIRGHWKFIKGLPDRLVEHMEQGRSFETFGAVIGRSRDYLYQLSDIYEDFKDAKSRGSVKSQYLWETLLQGQSSGKLVRLKKTTPVKNSKGDVIYNPTTGEPVTEKEFTPSMGSSRALIFAMQCRFEEYKDSATSNEDNYNALRRVMEANEQEKLKKIKK